MKYSVDPISKFKIAHDCLKKFSEERAPEKGEHAKQIAPKNET